MSLSLQLINMRSETNVEDIMTGYRVGTCLMVNQIGILDI